MVSQPRIMVPRESIEAFCRRWGVREFALFGSVLRDDFGPHSDVDVLLDFEPGHGLEFENTHLIIDELRALFGRAVDVVEKSTIRNRIRRKAILDSAQLLYAA